MWPLQFCDETLYDTAVYVDQHGRCDLVINCTSYGYLFIGFCHTTHA